ncbi:hypothetical protein C8R45DRAFT_277938 [Mycena sanguinolenta]|nr:hypothetical protein C8R45DRAFT_277938 [Mycena sanguinolenta]
MFSLAIPTMLSFLPSFPSLSSLLSFPSFSALPSFPVTIAVILPFTVLPIVPSPSIILGAHNIGLPLRRTDSALDALPSLHADWTAWTAWRGFGWVATISSVSSFPALSSVSSASLPPFASFASFPSLTSFAPFASFTSFPVPGPVPMAVSFPSPVIPIIRPPSVVQWARNIAVALTDSALETLRSPHADRWTARPAWRGFWRGRVIRWLVLHKIPRQHIPLETMSAAKLALCLLSESTSLSWIVASAWAITEEARARNKQRAAGNRMFRDRGSYAAEESPKCLSFYTSLVRIGRSEEVENCRSRCRRIGSLSQ